MPHVLVVLDTTDALQETSTARITQGEENLLIMPLETWEFAFYELYSEWYTANRYTLDNSRAERVSHITATRYVLALLL